MKNVYGCFLVAAASLATDVPAGAQHADLILHHGNVVTVNKEFHTHQAVAIRDGRIQRVGDDADVLSLAGSETMVTDLQGRTVLPGLIDSHTHPGGASMLEFDHPLPTFDTIQDVLAYIRIRAAILDLGEWIVLRQVFITRLADRRYPTRAELDAATARHPVMFATGPDASLNSLALEVMGVGRDTKAPAGSKIERTASGQPTGIVRNFRKLFQLPETGREPTDEDRDRRLLTLLKDYTSVGLTAIGDRAADAGVVDRYLRLRQRGELPLRIAISRHIKTDADVSAIIEQIAQVAAHPLRRGDANLRIVGIKTFLDGGMLTGSAYLRRPWGVSTMYGIDDPTYRGLRFIEPKKLEAIVRATARHGLQFTAHSVGDGAVHALITAYERVAQDTPLRATRPCITHCNFMSAEAIEKMAAMGIVADIQPAWLWLDTSTLHRQFGNERMRWFQPLRTCFEKGVIIGGGSDHMQKIGSLRAVNPYNPWLGMWITITRKARRFEGSLHPEEALSRQQALRFYTINNAYLLFLEDEIGTIEQGKQADLIVIDRDILTCPVDAIRETRVLSTYVAGQLVYSSRAR